MQMNYTTIIIYTVLVVLAFIVIILSLNLLKKMGLRSSKSSIKNLKDEAFNKIESTKSIAVILGKKGVKVGPAIAVLDKAESLYNRGDYNGSISLSDEARRILDRSKLEGTEIPKDERLDQQRKEELPRERNLSYAQKNDDETVSPSFQLQKKLPENYLAAKFSLEMAQNLYDGSDENRKIIALEYLRLAKNAFEENNYSDSLKYSLRTQKILKNEEIESGGLKCPKCGVEVDSKDQFCWNCGYTLKVRKCPNCGAGLKPTDKYCRSCGYKIV
ncbi:MAG: zinc ribbon domain-containing protein [Thermoplasmata archaeon]